MVPVVPPVLAYIFWHRPADGASREPYEAALAAFHAALAAHPPPGFAGSAAYRLAEAPWLPGGGDAYEDWYRVDGWEALGQLNEAAVRGPRAAPHDAVAGLAAAGAGAVYRLLAGAPPPLRGPVHAAWVDKPAGMPYDEAVPALEELGGGVWRRQMVLGPAPEFAVLTDAPASPPWPAVATRPVAAI
jgi:hypothetical protein